MKGICNNSTEKNYCRKSITAAAVLCCDMQHLSCAVFLWDDHKKTVWQRINLLRHQFKLRHTIRPCADIVKIVDGDFYLVEDGVADIPQIEIQNVVIKKPEIFDIDTSVDIDLFPKRNGQNKISQEDCDWGNRIAEFQIHLYHSRKG